MIVSACHGALIVVIETENGGYYECVECHKPCDGKFCLELGGCDDAEI